MLLAQSIGIINENEFYFLNHYRGEVFTGDPR